MGLQERPGEEGRPELPGMWNPLQDNGSTVASGSRQRWICAGTLVLAFSGTFIIGFVFGRVHSLGKPHKLAVLSLRQSAAAGSAPEVTLWWLSPGPAWGKMEVVFVS